MSSKKTKINKDEASGEFYFDINDFSDIVDISKVVYCEYEETSNGGIALRFLDKDKKQLELK